jgi:predicted nucleotidyltransferase
MAIFGSFSRNQQTEQSDIDILVEFSRPIGMEFMELADELEEIVQLKVDLVSKNGLKNHHFKAIQQELSYVYARTLLAHSGHAGIHSKNKILHPWNDMARFPKR